MKSLLIFLAFSFIILSCQNEVTLKNRDGWIDGYNIEISQCPINDFSITSDRMLDNIFFITPQNLYLEFIANPKAEPGTPITLDVFIDGKKITNLKDFNKPLFLDFSENLSKLKFLENHTIEVIDTEFSKCLFQKNFTIVCSDDKNYMSATNSCGACNDNQIYANQSCELCPGSQVNNGENICYCSNGAINETCNQCATGLLYLADKDICGNCQENQIYSEQICKTCPGKQVNNGENTCSCSNGALNIECNECPTGLLYMALTDSCSTCEINQIYSNQSCITCPGNQVNNGQNICACSNGAINDECNACPNGLLYLSETNTCGTCSSSQIYVNQNCIECPIGQVNNGENACICTNGAINENCDECPDDLIYIEATKTCSSCASNQIFQDGICTNCPIEQINDGNNNCVCINGASGINCDQCTTGLFYFPLSKTCGTCDTGTHYISETKTCGTCPPGTHYLENTHSCGTCSDGSFYDEMTLSCLACSTSNSYNLKMSPTNIPWSETSTFEANSDLFVKACSGTECISASLEYSFFIRNIIETEDKNIPLTNISLIEQYPDIFKTTLEGKVGGDFTVTLKDPNKCNISTSNIKINAPCTPGKRLALWLDTDSDGIADIYRGAITTYKGTIPASENYNYFSASAHPINGPTPTEFESHVFFYEDSSGLNLNFYHNVDEQGSADNIVNWDIETFDNTMSDNVVLSDDGGELKLVSEDPSSFKKKYEGRFHYWLNTDGGVIGPFNGTDFKIHVSTLVNNDNINASFYSADGTSFSLLKDGQPSSISSFIITFENDGTCGQ